MGLYQRLKETFRNQTREQRKEMLVQFRKEPATLRIARPTRLDRARSLGYKAKQGIFIVRQRVQRGGHERPHYRGGKRTKNQTSRLVLDVSYQRIAETRAARKFVNCEVLNSYYVAKDGQRYWYEVIMVDKKHPAVLKDKNISWIAHTTGRAFRGLTSAGKKSRGLRNKGKGAEKIRKAIHKNRM